MNNNTLNFYGCIISLIAAVIIAVALIAGGAYLAHEVVAWHQVNSTADIARLQAQEHITIGCMQYSWVTSSPICMVLGGVNGGINLWKWAALTAGLVIAWKVVNR